VAYPRGSVSYNFLDSRMHLTHTLTYTQETADENIPLTKNLRTPTRERMKVKKYS